MCTIYHYLLQEIPGNVDDGIDEPVLVDQRGESILNHGEGTASCAHRLQPGFIPSRCDDGGVRLGLQGDFLADS
ncbi:uncharacterized protein N7479_003653 [Penicillium vulpinum]|uniref:uncharacterized protein n=1 Tax=Penicillium vulpinum TaxID=29845 RepID=UPI002547DAF1|nr:uncharacterized protein N7479_003653 [Penicillium vulpinum]KAJ5963777.1 hypothetical protein N7479_003653 [Penicillium vulpinum]